MREWLSAQNSLVGPKEPLHLIPDGILQLLMNLHWYEHAASRCLNVFWMQVSWALSKLDLKLKLIS